MVGSKATVIVGDCKWVDFVFKLVMLLILSKQPKIMFSMSYGVCISKDVELVGARGRYQPGYPV